MKAGTDFHLAFSPEREDPGNPSSVVATIPKVVGGIFTISKCLEKALASSIRCSHQDPDSRVFFAGSAEATKLLENSFCSAA